MNHEISFNDAFVNDHIAELLALNIDKFIIRDDQIKKVIEILELASSTSEQLRAKRNSVVKLLTEDSADDAKWATMSGVTYVIDTCLWERGTI